MSRKDRGKWTAALRLGVVGAVLLVGTLALADTRSDARRYFNRGMEAIGQGRYREGIELLLKAYEIKPHPNVLFNVGSAYAKLGDVEEALTYFDAYLTTEPPDGEEVARVVADLKVRRRLRELVDQGMSAIAAGRFVEGIALLERAYEERPHPNLLYNMARAHEQAGDLDRALARYEAYARTEPSDRGAIDAKITELKARARTPAPAPKVEAPAPVARAGTEMDPKRLAEMIVEMVKGELGPPTRVEPPPPAPGTATGTVTGEGIDVATKTGAGYEEVVVTASRREQSPLDAPNAVTIITAEDIRMSGARSIPELLRRVPGMDVMAMSYSDWNISTRGFNRRFANKTLVLIDGRTAYQDFVGAMLWSFLSLDLLDIERIEVVRGPGSAIYGAYAYTGIVNIITKKPEDVGGTIARAAGGTGNVMQGTLQTGIRKGPVGLRASVGYEQADRYELEASLDRVDYTSDLENDERSTQKRRIDLTADYVLKSGARFFLGAGASDSSQELYGVAALRNQQVTGISANVRGGFQSDLFSVLVVWDRTRMNATPQFYRTGVPNFEASVVRADLLVVEPVFRPSFSLLGEHSLVLGGEYRHKFVDWDYLDAPHEEDFFAVFAQDAWAIDPRFTVLASARLDRHPLIGFLASPRAAFIFKPTPDQAIRASIGTAFRQPTQAENYLRLSAASPVAGVAVTLVGSTELDPENILTVDVGYLYESDFLQLEVVGYFNRVTDLITRSPLVPSSPAEGYDPTLGGFIGARSLYLNDPRAFFALGTELAAHVYPVDGLDLAASYAFQYIFDEESGDRFTDSPMHKATFWGQYRSSFGFEVGAAVHFVSDQDWIEPDYDPAQPSGFRLDPRPVPSSVVISGRLGQRLFDDRLTIAVSAENLADLGDNRHREHPFANHVEARVLGSVTGKF